MTDWPSFVTGLFEAAGRLGGTGADMLGERLELAALELREAKIRFIQALILACAGMCLCLLGLAVLIVDVALALPEQWRISGLAVMAGLCLLAGLGAFFSLRRRLCRRNLAFAQSLAELEKDKSCF